MKGTKVNQRRPVRLSLEQALKIVWLVEDLAGKKLSPAQDAVMMPLAEQIQVLHAQAQAALAGQTPARDIPLRGER